MNDQSWINIMHWDEVSQPLKDLTDEPMYTLTMSDFLNMPSLDFSEIVIVDPQLRALLN